jgi:hypothetical protein
VRGMGVGDVVDLGDTRTAPIPWAPVRGPSVLGSGYDIVMEF